MGFYKEYQMKFTQQISSRYKTFSGYDADADERKRFKLFVQELAKLSKQYGVLVHVTGGIQIVEPKEIKDIRYTEDATSGDLEYDVHYI
jgi:hypothetical protein